MDKQSKRTQEGVDSIRVDHDLVRTLARTWPKRATVCTLDKRGSEAPFDLNRPDYPASLVPFFKHPKFQALDRELQSEVLTWGWIGYNQRVVAAEDSVINPALLLLANHFLGQGDWHFREAMRQVLVDEHYHTLMHMQAIERTKQVRGIARDLALPRSVTYRRLDKLTESLCEPWEKELAAIAFAIVAEISVNGLLDALAKDETIQPENSRLTAWHNRDEHAHGRVLAEIGKVMFGNMTEVERRYFVFVLPEALRAFVAEDYTMWEAILTQLGVPDAEAIIAETKQAPGSAVVMRDYSDMRRFAAEIGILDDMEFDFVDTVHAPATADIPLVA